LGSRGLSLEQFPVMHPTAQLVYLFISGGHPVTLTGAQVGFFTVILSGQGTRLIIVGSEKNNTKLLTESLCFHLSS